MDLAKIGEVCTIEVPGSCYNANVPVVYVNERLAAGWVILSVKTMENPHPDRYSRGLHPSITTFVLGRPREKPPLTPIDTSTRDLQKFHLADGQCEGSNEPPSQ